MTFLCSHNLLKFKCQKCRGETSKTNNYQLFADMQKVEYSDSASKSSRNILKCSECGSQDVIIKEFQNRAADEGTTVIITCKSCGQTHAEK